MRDAGMLARASASALAVKTLCWGAAPANFETSKENNSSAPKRVPAIQLKLLAVPPLPHTWDPVRWAMPPPLQPLWGSSVAPSVPVLVSCPRKGQLGESSPPGINPQAHPPLPALLPQHCGSSGSAPIPLSPQPQAAAPAPSVSGEVPPRQRPSCQIPAKSAFLRHDTSGAPAGDGTRFRRSPQRHRYRHGSGMRGRLTQHRLPAGFLSLPGEVLAKYYKTSSFLPPRLQGALRHPAAAWPSPRRPSPSFLPAPFPGSCSRRRLSEEPWDR